MFGIGEVLVAGLVKAAVPVFGGWLTFLAHKYLRSKEADDILRLALDELQGGILEVHDVYVKAIKERSTDGVLTDTEAQSARAMALKFAVNACNDSRIKKEILSWSEARVRFYLEDAFADISNRILKRKGSVDEG